MYIYSRYNLFLPLLMSYKYWWQPLNFLRGWWTIISHKEEGRWYFRWGEGVAGGAGEGDAGWLGDAEEEQGPQTDDGQTGTADSCCNTAGQVRPLYWEVLLLYISCATVSDTFYFPNFLLTICSFSIHFYVHLFVLKVYFALLFLTFTKGSTRHALYVSLWFSDVLFFMWKSREYQGLYVSIMK